MDKPRIDDIALDRALVAKGGLREFVRLAWDIPYPGTPFIPGRHIDEVCTHLEAVSWREIHNLIVNIPPGCSKSSVTSVFWPIWDWVSNHHPVTGKLAWSRYMYASFSQGVVNRDAELCKKVIDSTWFRARWGVRIDETRRTGVGQWYLAGDGGGERYCTTIGGTLTGQHFHTQVIDDPTKPQQIDGIGLENAWKWYKGTASTRKADPALFARVIIMQRLHEADLVGRLLEEQPEEWVHLRLPMRYDAARPCVTPLGGDWRTEPGDLLCPDRFPEDEVVQLERDLGPIHTSAQLDQDPAPSGGSILKRDWMSQRWEILPALGVYMQAWDCSFKSLDESDYVVGQLWYKSGGEFFLVDQIRDKMDAPATIQAILDTRKRKAWGKARTVLVEDKANGPAVMQTLKKKVSGLVPWEPKVSKIERCNAVAPYFKAGNVFLPDSPWVGEYVDELTKFPRGRNDDQVDATSMALLYMTDTDGDVFKRAMARINKRG